MNSDFDISIYFTSNPVYVDDEECKHLTNLKISEKKSKATILKHKQLHIQLKINNNKLK